MTKAEKKLIKAYIEFLSTVKKIKKQQKGEKQK